MDVIVKLATGLLTWTLKKSLSTLIKKFLCRHIMRFLKTLVIMNIIIEKRVVHNY